MGRAIAGLAAVLLAGGTGAAQAQTAAAGEGLTVNAAERVRYETIDDQPRAGFNQRDSFVNFRTVVTAQFRTGPLQLEGELWDSRVYGANRHSPVSTNDVNTLEPVQAFARVDLGAALGPGSTLAVQGGRFLLNLGSKRLVAADEYRNTTNGYTGLRIDAGLRGGWQGSFLYTLPQVRRPDSLDAVLAKDSALDKESFDLVLWGGVVSRAHAIGPAMVETSFFHLGERDSPGHPTRDRSLNTASLRIVRDPAAGAVDYELEVAGQGGRISTSLAPAAPRQTVAAWFVHARAGYSFASPWKPRLALEYDYASGDRPGSTYRHFDTLFGMRRADFAPAGLYNAVTRANIVTPGIRLEVTPDARTDGFLSYRPMWLASRYDAFATTGVRDASGRSGLFAGHQFDSRIRYKLSRLIRLEGDFVLLAKGRFLRDAPNAPPGRWTRYVSLNLMLAI